MDKRMREGWCRSVAGQAFVIKVAAHLLAARSATLPHIEETTASCCSALGLGLSQCEERVLPRCVVLMVSQPSF